MEIKMKRKDELEAIIDKKLIYPVFQPIVSLRTGEVHGYEALSRMIQPRKIKNTEELFAVALLHGRTWDLEKLCRKRILKKYADFSEEQQVGKLFINVNPCVMMDENFKASFTRRQLEKYHISPEKIVIEITEKSSVNMEEFALVIHHYKKEGYQIAIDDVGACYSGLNIICNTHPHYLKIDMMLVQQIDRDHLKQALVKGLVEIAKNASIQLLAEGIETEAELQTLMDLGVDYGQGYFLGYPEKMLSKTNEEAYRVLNRPSQATKMLFEGWNGRKYKLACFNIEDSEAYEVYAEKYGDEQADLLIQRMFQTIRKALISYEMIHIMDERTCIAFIEKSRYREVCAYICNSFQNEVMNSYDLEDKVRGYMEKPDTGGKIKKISLLSIKLEEIL